MEKPNANTVEAALVVAYQRPTSLSQLLLTCISNGITRIYVHLDGPASSSARSRSNQCLDVIKNFEVSNPGILRYRFASHNLGAASSVLSACNWIFEQEEFAIILEDDCLPSHDFFEFVSDARRHLEASETIHMISGSQLAPRDVTGEAWSLSFYLMIWGWATSRQKWLNMYHALLRLDLNSKNRHHLSRSEFIFWKSGARRAFQGFVDAWDLPLMLVFRLQNMQTIVPSRNLVTNVGDDTVATHTSNEQKWTNMPLSTYIKSSNPPRESRELDFWLKKNFYRISIRHLLTTRITYLKDSLLPRRIRLPLQERFRLN